MTKLLGISWTVVLRMKVFADTILEQYSQMMFTKAVYKRQAVQPQDCITSTTPYEDINNAAE